MSIEIGLLLITIIGVYVTIKIQQTRFQEAQLIIKESNMMGKYLLQVRVEKNLKGNRPSCYGIYQYKDESILIEIQLSSTEAELIILTPNLLKSVVGLKIEQNGKTVYKRWQ